LTVNVEDLKIGEVAQLLHAYRQLYMENDRLKADLSKLAAKK
jgi:hypothetical protein